MDTNKPAEENILSDYYEGYQQLQLKAAESQVRKARNALFVVAGLTLIINIFFLSQTDSLSGLPLILLCVITGVYLGLALLTKKIPYSAIIIALIIFIGLWVLDIIVLGPEYIYRGVLFKGIIIYVLVRALTHAKEAEKLRREMSNS